MRRVRPFVSAKRQRARAPPFDYHQQAPLSAAVAPRMEPIGCTLPMDLPCGCRRQRAKDQEDAQALQNLLQKPVNAINVDSAPEVSTPPVLTGMTRALSLENTFHRRPLPQVCIPFSSSAGKRLFKEALRDEYMQIYFPLAEQFTTQAEPAFCGLATLAMCLNALQIDPGRLWKGPWRWFSEELFDCCTSLSVAKERGISLAEFVCLARCNGVMTDERKAAKGELSLDEFRDMVKDSCASEDKIVVLNYSRKALGQTGEGHFSPIGGYHPKEDMVLLLDVARFKYPPHWVKLPLAYEAMQQHISGTDQPRGLVTLKENAHAVGPTRVKQQLVRSSSGTATMEAPRVCCSNAPSLEATARASNK